MSSIKQNIEEIRKKVDSAAKKAGRNPANVKIIAVTKTASIEQVRELLRAGIKDFGENKVQEAEKKISSIADPEIKWHMIGHLQTNKVKKAISMFCQIHSVDGIKLAKEINNAAADRGFVMPVLVEVNVSGEETKYGIKPEEVTGFLNSAADLKAIEIRGLMTMAPSFDNPQDSRPLFKRLHEIARSEGLKELSMGMSSDFEVAIEEGATIIRIGQAIFKPR
jgi:hypothetical protein